MQKFQSINSYTHKDHDYVDGNIPKFIFPLRYQAIAPVSEYSYDNTRLAGTYPCSNTKLSRPNPDITNCSTEPGYEDGFSKRFL